MKRIFMFLLIMAIPAIAFAEEEMKELPEGVPEEGFSYSGYARGGVAGNAQGEAVGSANSFTANGAFNQARLGNEGNYSEHLLSYTGHGDSMWWSVNTRVAFDIPEFGEGWNNISGQNYGTILPESYLQMGWMDNGVSLWAGNRYNDSIAIDMYDYYINDLSNAFGSGIDGLSLGNSKWSLAYLMAYENTDGADADGNPTVSRDGTIHSFVVRPHFNLGHGTLSFKVVPTIATGFDGARYGAILESSYKFGSFFGLAEGSTELFGYYDFGTGVNDVKYNYHTTDAYRTGGGVQASAILSDKWSMKTTLMTEARGNQAVDTDGIWSTFAIRPYYAVTESFGLMAEYDFDHFSFANSSNTSVVNRVTLAPTVTLDTNSTVFSSPMIQFYMSYAYGDLANTADDVFIDGTDDMGFKYGVNFTVSW